MVGHAASMNTRVQPVGARFIAPWFIALICRIGRNAGFGRNTRIGRGAGIGRNELRPYGAIMVGHVASMNTRVQPVGARFIAP